MSIPSQAACWGCRNKGNIYGYEVYVTEGSIYKARFKPDQLFSVAYPEDAFEMEVRRVYVDHFPKCAGPKCETAARKAMFSYTGNKDTSYLFCGNCYKIETSFCQFLQCRCTAVVYCSVECQRAHWKTHKVGCEKPPACEGCGKKKLDPNTFKGCDRCRRAIYCSRKCQKQHWKLHKKACKRKDSKVQEK